MSKYYTVKSASKLLGISDKTLYKKISSHNSEYRSYIVNEEKIVEIKKDDIKDTTILSLINLKGGVAKTTSAVNIAVYLAKCGFRTLLLDTDHQNHCRLFFKEYNQEKSIDDILFNDHSIKDVVSPTDIANLSLVSGSYDIALKEVDFNDIELLKRRINEVKDDYDFVIIDNAPSLNKYNIASIIASTHLLIPTTTNKLGYDGITNFIYKVKDLIKNEKIKLLGVFLTLFEERTSQHQHYLEEFKNELGDYLFENMIPKDVRLSEIASFGLNIFDYKEKSRGSQAYKKLTKELVLKV